jgi:hypothetical protein
MFSNLSSTAAMNDSSSSSVPAFILRAATDDSDSSLTYVPLLLGTIALLGIALCYFRPRSMNLFGFNRRSNRTSREVDDSTPFNTGYQSAPVTRTKFNSRPAAVTPDSPDMKAETSLSTVVSSCKSALFRTPDARYDQITGSDNDGDAIELDILGTDDNGVDHGTDYQGDGFEFLNNFHLQSSAPTKRY